MGGAVGLRASRARLAQSRHSSSPKATALAQTAAWLGTGQEIACATACGKGKGTGTGDARASKLCASMGKAGLAPAAATAFGDSLLRHGAQRSQPGTTRLGL